MNSLQVWLFPEYSCSFGRGWSPGHRQNRDSGTTVSPRSPPRPWAARGLPLRGIRPRLLVEPTGAFSHSLMRLNHRLMFSDDFTLKNIFPIGNKYMEMTKFSIVPKHVLWEVSFTLPLVLWYPPQHTSFFCLSRETLCAYKYAYVYVN